MASLVGFFFIATLLFVHFLTKAVPVPIVHPLDVDEVPFPAAGQASTVFSLTALFGAYYGMFVILGIYALVGLAAGSIVGLFLIRRAALDATEKRYEAFIFARLLRFDDPLPIATPVAAIQVLFAVSELLILRRVLGDGFGLLPFHATMMTTFIALIGYTYSLTGGYRAIFSTDIVQLVLVLVMCFALLAQFVDGDAHIDFAGVSERLAGAHPGHWFAGTIPWIWLQHVFDVVIAFPMGMTFLLSSPDTWKRVFIVATRDRRRRSLFLLVAAGALPFGLILPLAFVARRIDAGPINPLFILEDIARSRVVMTFTLLGMISSFLSAFNSAFISATHLILLQARRWNARPEEIHYLRYLASGVFVVIIFFFLAGFGLTNPYSLGNLLLGPYCIAGGIVLGLGGGARIAPARRLLWIWATCLLGWVVYLIPYSSMFAVATTREANTIPPAIVMFLAVGGAVVLLSSKYKEPLHGSHTSR